MKVTTTNLQNLLLFTPEDRFQEFHEDFRGSYRRPFDEEEHSKAIFEKIGVNIKFLEEDSSTSFKNVLRGIHGDEETWKLIDCLYGKVYVVIVNCIRSSPDFGKWQAFLLSDSNRHQILVPPNFGTSHLVLSDVAIFHYHQSTQYNPEKLKQFTYRWNDPKLDIHWPISNPILSKRDETAELIS
tara:strand:- start:293 stop:844 length:552 start_codon:yes stop_codon:yes gene_type:complete